MTYAVVALAIIVLALLALVYALIRSTAKERSDAADALERMQFAGIQERTDRATAYEQTLQTLADRVQAPHRIPVAPKPDFAIPEHEPDEWNKVGSIVIDDHYGIDD